MWSSEQAVDGFTLDQVAEKRNILGNFEKIDQPCTGAEQADRRLANSKSMRLNRGLGFRKIFQAEDLPHCRHIEPEKPRERGDLFRGFDNLTFDRNIEKDDLSQR